MDSKTPPPIETLVQSIVANPSLAESGEARISWARGHMPVLGRIRAEFERDKPLKGRRIGMCLHAEAKTAVLVETLVAGGAEVIWTGSPATTDDGVAAAMQHDLAFGSTPSRQTICLRTMRTLNASLRHSLISCLITAQI